MAYAFGTCGVPNPIGGGIVDTYEKSSSCTLKTLEDCDGNVVEVKATGKKKTFRWDVVGVDDTSIEAGQEGLNGGIYTSVSIRYRRGDYTIASATEEAPVISP